MTLAVKFFEEEVMVQNRYIQSLTGLGAKAKEAASQTRGKIMEEYWPTIASVWREKVGAMAIEVASNDEKLSSIAKTIYTPLPLAFRLIVGEAEFVNFCLAHRDRLLPEKMTNRDTGTQGDEPTETNEQCENG